MFQSSLHLITSNRLRFSELSLAFFSLLAALAKHAFASLFSFPLAEQQLIVDSLTWGAMDADRRLYELALETMLDVLESVRGSEQRFKQAFYASFWLCVTQRTL